MFADSDNAVDQRNFGIGAGCQNEVDGIVQTAIPPVRLASFASAFVSAGLPEGARNLYSVCDEDYTPAIHDIVAGIEVELPPACFPGCVLDVDDTTEALEFSCEVLQSAGSVDQTLPECERVGDAWELPAGADACWWTKSGAELASECVEDNRNLEFEIVRREGVSVPGDVEVSAICELSKFPSIDCGA